MNKKLGLLKVLTYSCFAIFSCTSENEESIRIDCTTSNLTVTTVNTTAATCETGGTAEIMVIGGNGDFTYIINGTEQNSEFFTNLAANSYEVEVIDANGCMTTGTFVIIGSDDTISASASIVPSSCNENTGQISITATGGDEDFSYSLNGRDFQTENTFTSLAAEVYSISVKDGNGCLAEVSANVNVDISLSRDVMPIIASNCAVSGCHRDTRNPFLNTKEEIIQNANRIAARASSLTAPMPPSGLLDQSNIDRILCWVDNGALDN